jgi:pullulanase
LHKIKPDILLYGEGWTAGDSPLPDSIRALKKNAWELNDIAVFSDDIRDGIKGSVFNAKDRGFVSGKLGMEESVKFGIVAACEHPQIDYSKDNYSKHAFAAAPGNVVTYCECHDNNTLWDKLALSRPDATEEDRKAMHQLALTIVLTSQGIPFLHAGTEFLRSKNGVENSYKSGDDINAIKWSLKKENIDVTNYVKQLIKIRKEHPAFRMTTTKQVAENILFDQHVHERTIAYTINGAALGDKWKNIFIAFNGSDETKDFSLPDGHWKMAIETGAVIEPGKIQLKKYSSVILYID